MPSTTDPSGRVVVSSSLSTVPVSSAIHSEVVVDDAAEVVGPVVIVVVATWTGVLVVEVGAGTVVRLALTVGVEGVVDGPSEVQEGMINTRVVARAGPLDRPAGRRGRSR